VVVPEMHLEGRNQEAAADDVEGEVPPYGLAATSSDLDDAWASSGVSSRYW
jgi:hypothetical protein